MVTVIAEKLIFNNAVPKVWPESAIEEEIEIEVHLDFTNSYAEDRILMQLANQSLGSGQVFVPFVRTSPNYAGFVIPSGATNLKAVFTSRNMDALFFNKFLEGREIQLVVAENEEGQTFPQNHYVFFDEIINNYESSNTGFKGWHLLEEYNTATGEPTGQTKPNAPLDPDYVPPVYDPTTCPI